MQMPGTNERILMNTDPVVNAKIEKATLKRLKTIGNDQLKINQRLEELDQEWDIERYLFAMASTGMLVTLGLGLKNRRWLALTAVFPSFLFLHAFQGWCPPLPILRRLGVRTEREIDNERFILKAKQRVMTKNMSLEKWIKRLND